MVLGFLAWRSLKSAQPAPASEAAAKADSLRKMPASATTTEPATAARETTSEPRPAETTASAREWPTWVDTLAMLTTKPTALKPTSTDTNPAEGSTTYSYSIPPLTKVELTTFRASRARWDLEIDGESLSSVLLISGAATEVCRRTSKVLRGPESTMRWLRLDRGPLRGAYVISWSSDTSLAIWSRDEVLAEMRYDGAGGTDIEAWLRGRCGH